LKIEPEKKSIDVSKLLREFFNRYYLAQHMSLVILSKGMQLRVCYSVIADVSMTCSLHFFKVDTRIASTHSITTMAR